MYPEVHFLGITVRTYWLCSICGFCVAGLLALVRYRKNPGFHTLQQVDITNAAGLGLIGIVLGGRAVYIISILPMLWRMREYLAQNTELLWEILSNGIVFYGGLLGFLLVIHIYLKHYKINEALFWDYLAPSLPLFHVFGRIGCFLTGCCHGLVSEQWGISYSNSPSAENGIPYFPIQLVCSAGNALLCLATCIYEKRHRGQGKALSFYLFHYAVCRFVVEFWRGDAVRGIYGGLSTSQWISLLVLAVLALRYIRQRKLTNAKAASTDR